MPASLECLLKMSLAAFDIETLQPVVKPYSKGWKDLKLPRGHKDMLRVLVKNHLSEKESSTSHADQEHERDIVRGKDWIIDSSSKLQAAN